VGKSLHPLIKTGLAEFVASLMFSMAYFILLGRTQSEHFGLNILELSALIAFIYVIAVFVSSYKFESDLFPFYSLLRCFFEKSLTPLWLNIPAQLLGTGAGLGVYLIMKTTLLTLSPMADIDAITMFEITSNSMRGLTIAVMVFILTYSMIIIRKLFRLNGMTGTLVIAILVFVLSAVTLPVEQVSVIAWWQDIVLNLYHYQLGNAENLQMGWYSVVTAAIILATIFLANLKATQYIRPDSDQPESEEPGEFRPSFSKDYDI
jgi:hypothetical protein